MNVGEFVKIVFKNNIIIEGHVDKWADDECIISNLDTNKRFIIYNIKEAALFVQIDSRELEEIKNHEALMDDEQREYRMGLDLAHEEDRKQAAESFIWDEEALPLSMEEARLKTKSLAELKKMKIKQEREIVRNQLRKDHVPEIENIYQTPNFIKK